MRHPRLKPKHTDTYMHVYNRVAGSSSDFLLQTREKTEFIRRLWQLNELYVIDVLAFTVMDTHFHIVIHVPEEVPSCEETADRYNRFHRGNRVLSATDPRCAALAPKLRDVSEFMRHLQQPFTRWYNRTRAQPRRGPLWSNRFKNTVLESGLAVWDCWKYIIMNPVRAHIVSDPASYRFGSYGIWSASGHHPFDAAIIRHVLPSLSGLLHVEDVDGIRAELRKCIAHVTATEAGQPAEAVRTTIAVAGRPEPFSTRLDRRVRYWVDGLVIGSDLFVLNTVSEARVRFRRKRRRLTQAVDPDRDPLPLCSFKQLRTFLQ